MNSCQHGWRMLICAPPPLRGTIESTMHRGSTHGVPDLVKTNSTPRGLRQDNGQLEVVVKPLPKSSPSGGIQTSVISPPPLLKPRHPSAYAANKHARQNQLDKRPEQRVRADRRRTCAQASACAVDALERGALQTNAIASPPQMAKRGHASRNGCLEGPFLARNFGPAVLRQLHRR